MIPNWPWQEVAKVNLTYAYLMLFDPNLELGFLFFLSLPLLLIETAVENRSEGGSSHGAPPSWWCRFLSASNDVNCKLEKKIVLNHCTSSSSSGTCAFTLMCSAFKLAEVLKVIEVVVKTLAWLSPHFWRTYLNTLSVLYSSHSPKKTRLWEAF